MSGAGDAIMLVNQIKKTDGGHVGDRGGDLLFFMVDHRGQLVVLSVSPISLSPGKTQDCFFDGVS